MDLSWITLHPQWYAQEVSLLHEHYPGLRRDEVKLGQGRLVLYGNLVVRPQGGPKTHPIMLMYPDGTPYEHPSVTPLCFLPSWRENGGIAETPDPLLLDCRHQMPLGNLCLFQRETRAAIGGDTLTGIDVLRRAEAYFLGYHTGEWPPDTIDSELESHFHHLSDVLIADTFYESLPNGHGAFFCVPDLRRARDVKQQKSCPVIVTAMTAETPIITNHDAREELSRLYPWILNEEWNAYDQMISEASNEHTSSQRLVRGHWWSLPEEPHPFHDGKGLLQVLASVADNDGDRAWSVVNNVLGPDMATSGSHWIGLRYPARRGGREWLVLFVGMSAERMAGGLVLRDDASKRAAFEQSLLSVFRVHRLSRKILTQRNTNVVGECAQNKTVALIGLGALGSKVAELLAQAGVGHFRLCDHDSLRTGNAARHIGGVNDFGAPKIDAVVTRLLSINPYLAFGAPDLLRGSAVESLGRLSAFIQESDLVVCTTADESIESVVNEVALIRRKPVIYGRSLRKGSMGRVFLVRPGADACKACLAHYAAEGRRGEATPTDWIDIPEEPDEILYHECARPVIASSAIDLSFTATLIARVALSFLEGRVLDDNHWVWSQCANSNIDERLDRDFATVAGKIPPHGQCPACAEPDVDEVILAEQVRDQIVQMAATSPQAETGGILLGCVKDRKAIVLRCTGPGPNAKCTANEFRRDVQFVQSELERAAIDLGDRGLYIGEWHSHLVVVPEPSGRDIQSLFGISEAPNYLTRCPVMLIAGATADQSGERRLLAWVFPLSGRMYSVQVHVLRESNSPQIDG